MRETTSERSRPEAYAAAPLAASTLVFASSTTSATRSIMLRSFLSASSRPAVPAKPASGTRSPTNACLMSAWLSAARAALVNVLGSPGVIFEVVAAEEGSGTSIGTRAMRWRRSEDSSEGIRQ